MTEIDGWCETKFQQTAWEPTRKKSWIKKPSLKRIGFHCKNEKATRQQGGLFFKGE